jgi:hypothetical protein
VRLSQLILICGLALACTAAGLHAQPAAQPDAVLQLLRHVETAARDGDREAYLTLLASGADRRQANWFASTEIVPAATNALVIERDRAPLLPAGRHRVVADALVEFGARARVATWRFDVELTDEGARILDGRRLTAVEHLYRLSLDPARQYDAENWTIASEDLELFLESGAVFVADTTLGVTGLVLLGRGEMRFHPAPETEKGQLEIFCGRRALVTAFEAAFVRVNPVAFGRLDLVTQLTPREVDARTWRKAAEIFQQEAPRSLHLSLGDLSGDAWSTLPPFNDLIAEVRTKDYGTLTYARSGAEPEDVSLFDRKNRKNISVYASAKTSERRSTFFDPAAQAAFDVVDYNLDITMSPGRLWIDGVASLLVQVRAGMLETVTLKLADSLVVRSVESSHFGRLFGFRVKDSGNLVIALPEGLSRDTLTTLRIVYGGRLLPQSPDGEMAGQEAVSELPVFAAEPNFLYSNQDHWYPQPAFADYATATMKITVPAPYDCVASGSLEPGWPRPVTADGAEWKVYWFSAERPLRYLAFVVSRFTRYETLTLALPVPPESGAAGYAGRFYDSLQLAVAANPRERRQAEEAIGEAADVAQFYTSLLGDTPFSSLTLALVESHLPGGHSPGYFAVLNQPLPLSPFVWRNDPTAFNNFPEFFLAHELAHQWWGQAVGWRTYHEQWLSEGFAQYFAALYAEHARGPDAFRAILRRMRRSAEDSADQGPIDLGYRLGHLKGDARVRRAIMYNKGALVLHMLRRTVGNAAFFGGLRRFYLASRFRNAGTDDLQTAMEQETGRRLDRFFAQWVRGSTLPTIAVDHRVRGSEAAIELRQVGEVFDVPVTVTLQYADGSRADVLVPLTERATEVRLPLAGTLRGLEVNGDEAALIRTAR